jgi:hypothetical protein
VAMRLIGMAQAGQPPTREVRESLDQACLGAFEDVPLSTCSVSISLGIVSCYTVTIAC